MRCSRGLRRRVIEFVRGGGSKGDAAWRFQVGRASGYRWLMAPDGLSYQRPGPRGSRRREGEALRREVERHLDRTQKERARQFGVSRHCLWYGLQRLGVSGKKMLRDTERDPLKRKAYLCLRERYRRRGKAALPHRSQAAMPMPLRDSTSMEYALATEIHAPL